MAQQIPAETSHKLANMGLICAFLVVFIHVGSPIPVGSFSWWIKHLLVVDGPSRIAVPFFFLVAGYLLAGHLREEGWWPREVKKRVKSLVVPYLLWAFIHVVVYSCFTLISEGTNNNVLSTRLSLSWWLKDGLGLWLTPPDFYFLWFVRNLFLLCLASPLLKVLIASRGRAIVSQVVFAGCYILNAIPFSDNPLHLPLFGDFFSFVGLFYFSVGMALRYHNVPLVSLSKGKSCGVLCLAFLFFAVAVSCKAQASSWCGFFQMCGIPFALLGVWGVMPSDAWPRKFTALAFPIYLMHVFGLYFFAVPVKVILHLPNANLPYFIIDGLFAIVFSVCSALFLRRFFPLVAGLLFGGR